MVRAKKSTGRIARKQRLMKEAKGFHGSRSTLHRTAKEAVRHARANATVHRRKKKGDYRRLWIVRINAAARRAGVGYAGLIAGLKAKGIAIDRRVLAELAVSDPAAFTHIVAAAKEGGARAAR